MKNKFLGMFCAMSIFVSSVPVYAEEDYSNIDEWYERCARPQTTEEDVEACLAFQTNQEEVMAKLTEDIDTYSSDIQHLEDNTQQIEDLARRQRDLTNTLTEQINAQQAYIESVEANVTALQELIDGKQGEINVWDDQIKNRMRSEQASIGTNKVIDLIMGAKDLNDMIRRITGLDRITQNDQSQIDQINVLKQELEDQQAEWQRLVDQASVHKQNLETEQAQVEDLKASLETLEVAYRKQIAHLQAKKRGDFNDISAISAFMLSPNYVGELEDNDSFINPIVHGEWSAGTWQYPEGGLHLGVDWAVDVGTSVYAPANGVILYANNPSDSWSGFLGNWDGYPAGGGNTIEMLCRVNGTTYAVSFAHLSQGGFNVKAGDMVIKGQQIAYTGNSGNSSGGHCHIEVYNLGDMSLEEAVAVFTSTADFSWGTTWDSTATACEAGAPVPCRERPENFFTPPVKEEEND